MKNCWIDKLEKAKYLGVKKTGEVMQGSSEYGVARQ
jgi:hypothetical protein